MKDQPPKLAEQLFSLFCSGAFLEDLLGDLHEVYLYKRQRHGRLWSKIYYWYQAFRLGISYAIVKRKRDGSFSSYYPSQMLNTMLLNYVKISVRNILKNKTFSILNIFGLALGMSIGLLGLAFYVDINQFDNFHEGSEDIYRITTQVKKDGNKEIYASAPTALSYMAQEQLTGLEQSVHISDYFFPTIKTKGEAIRLQGYLTEPAFLDMFDFPLVSGTKAVLNQPGMVLITHESAQRLFGDKPALGQKLETINWGTLQVGGVLAPFPKKTHFAFDMLSGISPSHGLNESNETNWTRVHAHYLYLKTELRPSQIESQLATMAKAGEAFFDKNNLEYEFRLEALEDINPSAHKMKDVIGNVFEWEALFGFFGMALLILVPACLNYGNMSVANALKRSKEIGIRKIMGSPNRQIINQFLVETVIICLIALALSILMFDLIRGELLKMLVGGTALSMNLNPKLLLVFCTFAIFTGIFTGIIPALYFSRITPIKAIRKTLDNQKVTISGMRKALLVFQFVLSLVFMIGIGVLIRQYFDSISADQGFTKENVLVVPIKAESAQLVANTLGSAPAVSNISFTSGLPGIPLGRSRYFYNELDSVHARVLFVDDNFVDHMGIDMVWGSGALLETQFEQVLVNETLMSRLRNINEEGADSLVAEMADGKKVQIAGVIKDYNHEPLSHRIEPMVVKLNEAELTFALLSVSTNDIVATMNDLEERWDSILPEVAFEASFLDTQIEKAYDFILTGIKLFGLLAILAVTISCLGLLGMVIFTTENRKKEVAIRKTLGAGSWKLLYSLSGLFFRMWAIALLIAVPLSYIYYDKIMLRIYNKFSDGVGFSEVALSSLFTLGLGLLAIMVQSTKVMRTNPAESLRAE